MTKMKKWALQLVLMLPQLLLLYQVGYGILPLNSLGWKIAFVEFMLLCNSIAVGLIRNDTIEQVKLGTLTFLILNVVAIGFGGIIALNDAINGTVITSDAGIWFGLETMASEMVGYSILIESIVNAIPAITLIISVLSVIVGDNPDEYMTGIIESIYSSIPLIIYGITNKYFL